MHGRPAGTAVVPADIRPAVGRPATAGTTVAARTPAVAGTRRARAGTRRRRAGTRSGPAGTRAADGRRRRAAVGKPTARRTAAGKPRCCRRARPATVYGRPPGPCPIACPPAAASAAGLCTARTPPG